MPATLTIPLVGTVTIPQVTPDPGLFIPVSSSFGEISYDSDISQQGFESIFPNNVLDVSPSQVFELNWANSQLS